jgi:hypothetical protein
MSSLTIFTIKQILVMKIGRIVITICCLILMRCGDEQSTAEMSSTATKKQKNAITAKAIENFKYTDYALSNTAEKSITDWGKYRELAIQISYLKKADLSFFNSDKVLLNTFVQEFKASIPDQLRTNAIESRSVIIETMLLKLNDNLILDNIEINMKLLGIKDVLVAFSNFNYQINKKIEFDIYDKIKPE